MPQHVDQVLALRPVQVTILLPHLSQTMREGNRFDQSEAYLEHVDPEHMEQGAVGLLLELGGDGGNVGGAGLKNIDQ